MQLYVVLKGQNVIEACPLKIKGANLISATAEQIDKIMGERYDATSDGVQITSTSQGADYARLLEYRAYKEAKRMQEAELLKA